MTVMEAAPASAAEPAATAAAVVGWLRERQDEMVALLRQLALIETPSLCPETQAPAFDLLAAGLAGAGYRARRRRGRHSGGQLYAAPVRRARGRRAQLLLGHVDTVWPLGTLERMPVTLEAGRLSGPGVFDMKAGLIQGIFALRALHELGLDPAVTPVVFVSSDEEVWSPDSLPTIVRLARRVARVFVLEPALGPDGQLKTRRKGFGHFKVTVHGKAAHSGLEPEKGASAILEMAHVIQYLHGLADPRRGVLINVGTLAGGERVNVIPSRATAEVGLRLLTLADRAELGARIAALTPVVPGTRIEITGQLDRPPLERTPRNQALFAAAARCATALGFELGEGTAGGGSDGNVTSLSTATLDGLGAVGDGAHAAHEHVVVDRLPERAALLALLLLQPLDPPIPPGTAEEPVPSQAREAADPI
jgi:glutamate carboxypeptidase